MNLFMRKLKNPWKGLLVFEIELLGRKAVKHWHDCINYNYSLLSTLVWKELAKCSVGFPDVHSLITTFCVLDHINIKISSIF